MVMLRVWCGGGAVVQRVRWCRGCDGVRGAEMRSTLGDTTACYSHGVPDFLMIDITMSFKLKRIIHRVFYTFIPKIFKNLLYIFNVSFSSTSKESAWKEWLIILAFVVPSLYQCYGVFIDDESNETSYGKY